jgi:hypothetical protein
MLVSKSFAAAVIATTLGLIRERQSTDTVNDTLDTAFASYHLCGGARVARRHIHTGILCEEVARSEQHSHRLSRHDRIVLRCWEVCEAKRVPQDLDARISVHIVAGM